MLIKNSTNLEQLKDAIPGDLIKIIGNTSGAYVIAIVFKDYKLKKGNNIILLQHSSTKDLFMEDMGFYYEQFNLNKYTIVSEKDYWEIMLMAKPDDKYPFEAGDIVKVKLGNIIGMLYKDNDGNLSVLLLKNENDKKEYFNNLFSVSENSKYFDKNTMFEMISKNTSWVINVRDKFIECENFY